MHLASQPASLTLAPCASTSGRGCSPSALVNFAALSVKRLVQTPHQPPSFPSATRTRVLASAARETTSAPTRASPSAAAAATDEQEQSNGLSELVAIVSFPPLLPAQFSADRLSFSEQVRKCASILSDDDQIRDLPTPHLVAIQRVTRRCPPPPLPPSRSTASGGTRWTPTSVPPSSPSPTCCRCGSNQIERGKRMALAPPSARSMSVAASKSSYPNMSGGPTLCPPPLYVLLAHWLLTGGLQDSRLLLVAERCPPASVNAQEIAGNHAVGMWGRTDTGFANLPSVKDLIFVMSRLQIQMRQYPRW